MNIMYQYLVVSLHGRRLEGLLLRLGRRTCLDYFWVAILLRSAIILIYHSFGRKILIKVQCVCFMMINFKADQVVESSMKLTLYMNYVAILQLVYVEWNYHHGWPSDACLFSKAK